MAQKPVYFLPTDQKGVFESMIKIPSAEEQKMPSPITIYTDFTCTPCRDYALGTVTDLRKKATDSKPLDIHVTSIPFFTENEVSLRAAMSTQCAAEQNHFWEMHDTLFAEENLSIKKIDELVQKIGLNPKDFESCMNKEETKKGILEERETFLKKGIQELPITILGEFQLTGNQPIENIEWILRKSLN